MNLKKYMLIQMSEQVKAKGRQQWHATAGGNGEKSKWLEKLYDSVVNSALNQAGVGNWTSSLGK